MDKKGLTKRGLKDLLVSGCENLKLHEDYLNSLNVFPIPDGDTGTNMYFTLLPVISFDGFMLQELGREILLQARGNSGVILAQFLDGVFSVFGEKEEISVKKISLGFLKGEKLARKAVSNPVEGTILTVMSDVGRAGKRTDSSEIGEFIQLLTDVAKESVARTPDMLPVLKEAGVVDAGGEGFRVFLEGFLQSLKGEKLVPPDKKEISHRGKIWKEKPFYKFCMSFTMHTDRIDEDDMREALFRYGDSLMIAREKGLAKIHIHTNNPPMIRDISKAYGEIYEVEIKDMRKEQERFLHKQETRQNVGLVVVYQGEGIREIMQSLGVDVFIEGGRSMNPSINEILSGIKRVNADNVIVLPNDKNIIMASEKAGQMAGKNVQILPTKTIPEGISSILFFDSSLGINENFRMMKKALDGIKTGKVIKAIRDAVSCGKIIREGDFIGISGAKIKVVAKNENEALISLLGELISENDSLISIYYGSKVKGEAIYEKVKKAFPEIEVQVYYGGQPFASYFLSVE